MRALFVVPRYHPHIGGVEYVVKSVAERLAGRGHEVVVLCGESNIEKPCEELVNGVCVMRWPVYAPGDAYHVPRMRYMLKNWLLNTARESDVVHFHSVHSVLAMYSLRVLRDSRVRKVLTLHYHGTGHTLFRRFLWRGWRVFVKSALQSVDVVHTVSNTEAQYVARDFCVKSLTIEHGVEEWLSNISWNPSDYVMYSGRIEKYKNIHRLAKIVQILNEAGLNLKLKIFGDGPFKRKLLIFLDRLKVKYELNPPQPYKEYIHYLSKATLFGLLSEKEAFGQSVNEANALGVPVVIVEPWGLNFKERTRTLITKLSKSDEEIAEEIAMFLEEARKQPKSKVPSWSQVVDLYIKNLYSP
ncbi:MAG: glycosyltransferase family 4 protein [Desulfurococcaceae archaeon]